MKFFAYQSLPTDPKARQDALCVAMSHYIEILNENCSKIDALAQAGMFYLRGNEARGNDGDAVSHGLFSTISDCTADGTLDELRKTIEVMKGEFKAIQNQTPSDQVASRAK
ncbi:hypothetical protein AWB79_01273 [Caballeronia hypogeia]|uniref:Uncharacterized protein n=1 Tax=Caballeronia hypogeia TaxID=1777140 RepID=A0A157ZRZ3_9BURK|nr:hypothetical protein [Caballeronia hypogeia]SAK48281.1 hypothetical protein AWB79_01273 [Caballeronia hypogeia]